MTINNNNNNNIMNNNNNNNNNMNNNINRILIITLLFNGAVNSLEIIDFTVPRVVEVGSENVILDCNYNYKESEGSELEVKWYFNEDPSPFLVWIAGRKESKPQIIGSLFEGKIDLDYIVTEDDHTKHRAIMIHQPSIDMAGTYHCKVETLTSEATAEANMLIYTPVMETQFSQKRLAGSRVNISCRIAGVFPLPVTKLTWGVFELFEDHTVINHLEDDSYEVIIHKVLEHEELPAETVFGCEASIPGTEYFVREEAIYHHRGRRETEMKMIKKMEERRKAKGVFYSSNSVNKLDTEEVEVKEIFNFYASSSSSTSALVSIILITSVFWVL